MSRNFRNFLGAGLMTLLSISQLQAAGTEWTMIYSDDFGDGDSDFGAQLDAGVISSGMDFVSDYGDFAQGTSYSVTKHTSSDNGWHTGGDHTYPTDANKGYFLAVNPQNSQEKVKVYCHEVSGICSGVVFRFSTYLANLMLKSGDGTDPDLGIGIYKDSEATTLISSSAYKNVTLSKCSGSDPNTLDWEKLELEFEVSDNTQDYAYFIVTVNEPQAKGFDFAVDDILLEVQHPTVTIANVEEFEYGENIHLKASFENNGFFASNNFSYKWYYSADGLTYNAIGSGNPYTLANFDKDVNNGYYKVKIAEGGNFDSKVCALEGDFIVNETKNKKKVTLCKGETQVLNGTTLDGSVLTDGELVEGANNYTYVVSIVSPTVKTADDDYVCIGMLYAGTGLIYDSEQTIPINDTISSKVTGCDSLIILKNLVVTGPTEKTLSDKHICQGETYNGKAYGTAGEFEVKTSDGCIDYTQKVIVHPTYNIEKTEYLCAGSTYNGKTYEKGGTYSDVLNLQSVYGCDSVVNVTIEVASKIVANLDNVDICEGEGTYTFDGKTYSEPGIYNLSSTGTSMLSGCDSVTNVRLQIFAKYSNENNPIDTTICYGSQLFGTIYNEPTTTPLIVRDPTTYQSATGCDSIVYYRLTVLQLQLSLSVKADRNTVCRGEEIEIKVTNLQPANTPLDWPLGLIGSSQGAVFTPEKDLVCVVKAARTVSSTETCETTDTVFIYVRDSPILTIDSVDQRENVVTYNVEGGTLPYSIVLDKKEVSTEASGELRDSYIGSHTLTAVDSNQCASSQTYSIVPIPIYPSGYLSPNGDGVNDRWTIENIDVYSHARVRIFDRNGRLLQEYNGYDNEQGWDGKYNGHLMPATDYWYEINLPEIDDQYVGHFTLLYMQ